MYKKVNNNNYKTLCLNGYKSKIFLSIELLLYYPEYIFIIIIFVNLFFFVSTLR